ncbi:Gluconate 5-dehydrogenase [Nocardia otitidiscaviarum]|uniref:Gluconate 5-dehydrogenase n=1 Tax=Nocardia otitidiscaviarum TaxID=1823 RepID=A0A378YK23_9NOCA|nr:Gluconate 5-dehydrogenase [Nocardia otitidiscaviarum]
MAVPADVTDQRSLRDAARTVRAALGPVDLVVANADVMLGAPVEAGHADEWDRMVGTNINGLLG